MYSIYTQSKEEEMLSLGESQHVVKKFGGM